MNHLIDPSLLHSFYTRYCVRLATERETILFELQQQTQRLQRESDAHMMAPLKERIQVLEQERDTLHTSAQQQQKEIVRLQQENLLLQKRVQTQIDKLESCTLELAEIQREGTANRQRSHFLRAWLCRLSLQVQVRESMVVFGSAAGFFKPKSKLHDSAASAFLAERTP